jgi:hypothetical protein
MATASQPVEVHLAVRPKHAAQQLRLRHQQLHTTPLDSPNAADRPAFKNLPVRHASFVSSLAKSVTSHSEKQPALPRPPALRMAKDRPLAASSASVSLRGRLTASRAAVEAKARSGRTARSGRQFTVGSISHGLIYLRYSSLVSIVIVADQQGPSSAPAPTWSRSLAPRLPTSPTPCGGDAPAPSARRAPAPARFRGGRSTPKSPDDRASTIPGSPPTSRRGPMATSDPTPSPP